MGFERIRVLRHLLGGLAGNPYGTMDSPAPSLQSQAELRAMIHALHEHEMADQLLDDLSFAVIDTETTGFVPTEDCLLSIGAVCLDPLADGSAPGFHTYVKLPKNRTIPDVVVQLTGITSETVADAPNLDYALQIFLQFVGDRILVAHHAAHDIRFINVNLRKSWGVELHHQVLDTGKIAMTLHRLKKYPALDVLLALYEIETVHRHTALGDALMTAMVIKRQLAILKDEGVKTLGQLWERLLVLEHELRP